MPGNGSAGATGGVGAGSFIGGSCARPVPNVANAISAAANRSYRGLIRIRVPNRRALSLRHGASANEDEGETTTSRAGQIDRATCSDYRSRTGKTGGVESSALKVADS